MAQQQFEHGNHRSELTTEKNPPEQPPLTWTEVIGGIATFPLGKVALYEAREQAMNAIKFKAAEKKFGSLELTDDSGEHLSQTELNLLVRQFDDACNGGLTGIGTDEVTVRNVLAKVPPQQMSDFDNAYRDLHNGKIGVKEELIDEMSGYGLARARALYTGEASSASSDSIIFDNQKAFPKFKKELDSTQEKAMADKAPENLKPIYEQLASIKERLNTGERSNEKIIWSQLSADKRRALAAEIIADGEYPSQPFNPYLMSLTQQTRQVSKDLADLKMQIQESRALTAMKAKVEQLDYLSKLPKNDRDEMKQFENRAR